MSTILTGLRSNSDLHLGNYLGAILPMVNIQRNLSEEDRLFMFIPDLHSFTTPTDHGSLQANSLENVRVFIASGIDPNSDKTLIYRQSRITAHSELQWILSCFTYFGEANRMTEFKDKSDKMGNKGVTVGLFNYPILMASDILLYGADYVPLGDDQKQHMELTRTLAQRMNEKFENLFTVPKPWKDQLEFAQREMSVRIKSLSHPDTKMSKSVEDPKGTILLIDNPDEAADKIMTAQTDNEGSINFDFEKQPGISNLLQISALLQGKFVAEVAKQWQGSSEYGKFKESVAQLVRDFLTGFQQELATIQDEDIERTLSSGEEQANLLASRKLDQVQKAIGLR